MVDGMTPITIQKLADSCVRVEIGGHIALVDPGFYTWEQDELDLASMPAPDRLLITHNHTDHLSIEFVQALVEAYPAMEIETNEDCSRQWWRIVSSVLASCRCCQLPSAMSF